MQKQQKAISARSTTKKRKAAILYGLTPLAKSREYLQLDLILVVYHIIPTLFY